MTKEKAKYARAKEAAEFFCISDTTLYRWREEDLFPQPLKRGQTVLYNIPAIEKWLEGGAAQ